MIAWTPDLLLEIAGSEGVRIAPFREDGITCGSPTYIWAVVVNDGVYVRPYNGLHSSWYRAAIREKSGQIVVNRKTIDVSFAPADEKILDAVDSAYREKYSQSNYLSSMTKKTIRDVTIKILPRN